MRLLAQRLRQSGLLQQHRHRVSFRATPGGGDRRAAYRLRQDLLGEFEERLIRLFRRGTRFIAFIGGPGEQRRQFGQRFVVLQLFQIVEDGLLNQPVRRAVNAARGGFNALAGCVVKLNTHGGGAHAQNSCHLSLGLCGCLEISTMLQLCATLLIEACDESREMADLLKIVPKIAEF